MKLLLPLILCLTVVLAKLPAYAQPPAGPQQAAQPPNLTEYAGTYKFADNGYFTKLVLTVENNKLYGQVDENEKYEYVQQSAPDTFKSTSSYGSVFIFVRDTASKKVTGFKMQIMGNEVSGIKEK